MPQVQVQEVDVQVGRVELPCAAGPAEPVLTLIRGAERSGNEGSRSLEVRTSSGWSALLCGDAEEEGLVRSLVRGDLAASVDLVLLPHHGSQLRAAAAFLDRVAPAQAVVSCTGPAPLAHELARRSIPLWTTSRMGAFRTLVPPGPAHPAGPHAVPSGGHMEGSSRP